MEKRYSPPNPYATYPAESTEHLTNIVGLKNRGIKYNPKLKLSSNLLKNGQKRKSRKLVLKIEFGAKFHFCPLSPLNLYWISLKFQSLKLAKLWRDTTHKITHFI
jgi:hypothetical protein